jgi:hypothetical protein
LVIFQDPVVAEVHHVEIARSVNRDCGWKTQRGASHRWVVALRGPGKKIRLPDHQVGRTAVLERIDAAPAQHPMVARVGYVNPVGRNAAVNRHPLRIP